MFPRFALRFLVAFAGSLFALHAGAQAPGTAKPDPSALLAAAKAASGGAAWDALRTQFSQVRLSAANLDGEVERWSDVLSGRSMLRYDIGPLSGAAGFDGKVAWTQEGGDAAKIESTPVARELAVNAAYRDRLAFWYPSRAAAKIEFKERAEADGGKFDVVRITPEGGRAFELWIGAESRLIERLVEREAELTRTEHYSDRRDVQGVKIPFHVRTTRGDPKREEIVDVQEIVFNEPLAGIDFGPPAARPEYAFPAGRDAVDIPFETFSGHLFVRVMFDGRGPFRMLFDAGGTNVLSAQTAASLVDSDKPLPQTIRADVTSLGGVELSGQRYAVADIDGFLHRVEGLDDIAGVLGLEWFVRMPIRIDYARSRLTLYDPAKFKYAGTGTRVPVAARGRLPLVDGSIDGVDGSFEIDTGSRGSLTLAPGFAAKHDLEKRLKASKRAITGAGLGGPVRSLLARGRMLKLGTVEVPYPVVAIVQVTPEAAARTEVAGNVGNGVLRQFAVTFDLPNDSLYFERYLNFGTPDIADRGGMWLERAADGYKVVDVVAAGPAAAAGLKAGDVIVEVNGLAWSQTTLPALRDALRAPPGTRITVKTAAGVQATIVLADLV
ncbi:MAG: retropepsin-like domain-containing protein [Burkholderiales bacterium]|nr:retropepsin-like domain-containing protein [Burkholderiales bacterium]